MVSSESDFVRVGEISIREISKEKERKKKAVWKRVIKENRQADRLMWRMVKLNTMTA